MKSISALVFSEKDEKGKRIKKVVFCSTAAETLVRIAELLNNWLMYLYKYDVVENVAESESGFYYRSHLEIMLREVTDNSEELLKIIMDSCNIYTNVFYDTPFYVESYRVVDLPQLK